MQSNTYNNVTDPKYTKLPARYMSIDVVNDDNADAKLWTYNEPNNAYTYDVKFIGPLCNPEGSFIKYGIRLDTEPTHLVYISPEIMLVNKSDIKLPPK